MSQGPQAADDLRLLLGARIDRLEARLDEALSAQGLINLQQAEAQETVAQQVRLLREEGSKRHEKIKRFLRSCVMCSEIKQYTAFIEAKLDALRAALLSPPPQESKQRTVHRQNYSVTHSYRREAGGGKTPRGTGPLRAAKRLPVTDEDPRPRKTKPRDNSIDSFEGGEQGQALKPSGFKKTVPSPPRVERETRPCVKPGKTRPKQLNTSFDADQRPTLFRTDCHDGGENLISDIIALSNFAGEVPLRPRFTTLPEPSAPSPASSAEERKTASAQKPRLPPEKKAKFGELMRTLHTAADKELAVRPKEGPEQQPSAPASPLRDQPTPPEEAQRSDLPAPERLHVSLIFPETRGAEADVFKVPQISPRLCRSERMFFSVIGSIHSSGKQAVRLRRLLKRSRSASGGVALCASVAEEAIPALNIELVVPNTASPAHSQRLQDAAPDEEEDVVDYILDEQGFLCGMDGLRVLDDHGQQIKLEPEHLEYLRGHPELGEVCFDES